MQDGAFENSPAPGRPARRRRKEARPAEIIEAGLAEFAERGYAGARLDDVARRAGIAKGTIYRYFDDKEALFTAAVRSRVTSVLADLGAGLDAFPGSTPDLLRMVLKGFYARLVEGDLAVLVRIVVAEAANFPDLAAMYHGEVIARGRGILERLVARGIARGEFRAGAAADLPLVLMAPAMMATIWRLTFDPVDPIPPERFYAAHVDLVLNGIAVR